MSTFPDELDHSSGTTLRLDRTRVSVEFAKAPTTSRLARVLEELGLEVEPENGDETARGGLPALNTSATRLWLRATGSRELSDDDLDRVTQALGRTAQWVAPVYSTTGRFEPGDLVSPLPHIVVLRTSHPDKDADLTEVAEAIGLTEDPRSAFLSDARIFTIDDVARHNAYDVRDELTRSFADTVRDVRFETVPMTKDTTVVPNDTFFAQQWGMAQIQAGGPGQTAWDISTGVGATVAVIDDAFDISHPDLPLAAGVDLGTMGPAVNATADESHGTACAGIVGAAMGNGAGVSGVAPGATILPVARSNSSDVEVGVGINWAVANGAQVISMSFGRYHSSEGLVPTGWDFTLIDPEIAAAAAAGVVMCAATGNHDFATTNVYPARHPDVIACGASDQNDDRKNPASPDGENWWGSNYGTNVHNGTTTGVSVVAPGVLIPTTDRRGNAGYSVGDYVMTFNGTSSATPHVAGLAALLFAEFPTLTGAQVRSIIERTAEKVGTIGYAHEPGSPSGTRNQEMGYGRINALRALDQSDVMIRDFPGDTGTEPSNPPGGNFWDLADIVLRPLDDNVFLPADPSSSSRVERGQPNFLYVRVVNNGPNVARNVTVTARITAFAGSEFVHPHDWTATDATHVVPTAIVAAFPSIAVGAEQTAKFEISAAQVDELWTWQNGSGWHPCLLASVTADNDYAWAGQAGTPPVTPRRKNLAQRNLSVVDDVASAAGDGLSFAFVAGSRHTKDRMVELVIDRTGLPHGQLALGLDGNVRTLEMPSLAELSELGEGIEFLHETNVKANLGGHRGLLTMAAGSKFATLAGLEPFKVDSDLDIIIKGDKRIVRLVDRVTSIRLVREPGRQFPLELVLRDPDRTSRGGIVRIAQRDSNGTVVGGVSFAYTPQQVRPIGLRDVRILRPIDRVGGNR